MANDVQEIKEKAGEAVPDGNGGLMSSLLSKEIILPALATAGAVVAYAARNKVSQKAEDEAEDVGGAAAQGARSKLGGSALSGAASKLVGGGGSAKKTRRLPIQR